MDVRLPLVVVWDTLEPLSRVERVVLGTRLLR